LTHCNLLDKQVPSFIVFPTTKWREITSHGICVNRRTDYARTSDRMDDPKT